MKDYVYKTSGVCAKSVAFSIEDGKLHNVRFHGGCPGNTLGIATLVEGMDAAEAAQKLAGIRCGFKPTSCPDQLARALQEAVSQAE